MNSINIFNRQLRIAGWLLWRDLIELKDNIKMTFIDGILWPLKSIILFGYIMPGLGLPGNYGGVILVGTIVTVSFFRIFDGVNKILQDSEIYGLFDYQLTLPVSSIYIFSRFILIFALRAMFLGLIVYVAGSVLLVEQFNFIPNSLVKTILLFFLLNFVFASATLLVAGSIKGENIYHSFFAPLLFSAWDFGCYLYSWEILYQTIPLLALLVLFNPITYAMEGFRNAVLGPDTYINFWICAFILIVACTIFSFYGIKKLKKKFDSL